jgi:hypothetical protein
MMGHRLLLLAVALASASALASTKKKEKKAAAPASSERQELCDSCMKQRPVTLSDSCGHETES